MGPRSDNRGYVKLCCELPSKGCRLQWVHGPITVVMTPELEAWCKAHELQWVHGPITVVMSGDEDVCHGRDWLQWVHGPITVVMIDHVANEAGFLRASMGPRSDNRGYASVCPSHPWNAPVLQWVHGPITVVMGSKPTLLKPGAELQWVHGPITVVMAKINSPRKEGHRASMGPRSDNRGYVVDHLVDYPEPTGFNGSTVR